MSTSVESVGGGVALLELAASELDRLWRSGDMSGRRSLRSEVLAELVRRGGEYRTASGVLLIVTPDGDGFWRDDPAQARSERIPPGSIAAARAANRRRPGPAGLRV